MKLRYIVTGTLFILGINHLYSQDFNINLETDESNEQYHQARNEVTFLPGYSYTPGVGEMTAVVVNPVVSGSTSYGTKVDPASRGYDFNNLVGTTSGALNVSGSGGATYSIPIAAMPGVNGMTPNISLIYSSGSGPGLAGYGWQIGGISAISRSPQNYYNDSKFQGVSINNNDRFSIDGQRLVLTSGTYGDDQATYSTEQESFMRVKQVGNFIYGPSEFIAQAKGGITNYYGGEDDGRQRLDEMTEVFAWYVSKSVDIYGNSINYSYLRDNNMFYPGEISYGPNKITFYYKTRTDITYSYFKNHKITQSLLLDRIVVSYNNSTIRSYQLKYVTVGDNYNSYSALNEVVEKGTGDKQLNSLVFSYATPSNLSMQQKIYDDSNVVISYNTINCQGDYNGDGISDFLSIPTSDANWTGTRVNFGSGTGGFNSQINRQIISTINIDVSKLGDYQSLDINGDGNDDFLYELVYSGISTFYYCLCDGLTLGQPIEISSQPNSSLTGMSGKFKRIFEKQEKDNELSGADYNGDGINDLFINDPNGNWKILSMANSNGVLTSSFNILASGTISTLADRTISSDFNGDGKVDIWSIESGFIRIYSLSGTTLSVLYSDTWLNADYHYTLGDFNGDGKVDVFVYGFKDIDWTTWKLYLSKGTIFEQVNIKAKKSNLQKDIVRVADFNGDGFSDVMATSSDQSWDGVNFYLSSNRGTDFTQYTMSGYPLASHNFYVMDSNGDGRSDFMCTDGESPWWRGHQVYASTGYTKPLLTTVANSLNQLTTINYSKLSDIVNSKYSIGTKASFPLRTIGVPMDVVTSVSSQNGVEGSNVINYTYEGATVHCQGKGFLGYNKQTVTDVKTGFSTISQYGIAATYYYPQLKTVTKQQTTSGSTTVCETITNSWSQKVLDATTKRIFPYVESSVLYNPITNQRITNLFSYDTYGNQTDNIRIADGYSQTTHVDFTNTVTSSDWLLGRPDVVTISSSLGGSSVNRITKYSYNTTDAILKPDIITYNSGTNQEYTVNSDYDSYGNLKQAVTAGSNIGTSQVSYTYTPDNTRMLTQKDPLGHTTQYGYNSYGQLQSEKDFLNNETTYTYDELGRVATITNPEGTISTNSFIWTGTNKPSSAVYGMTQSGNDGSSTTAWYDKLGREIQSETKNFNGTMTLFNTEYNTKGQVYRVSDPYIAGGSIVWAVTNVYDNLGRIISITRNSGQNTSYTYEGAKITETTAGKSFSKTYNSSGEVVSATDNGGTISYAYYPDHKLKTITAPDNVVTTIYYEDGARNQTKLVDPSAGTITYTYDSYGRVKTQTDARNKTTTTNYKTNGLVESTITPEGTISYTYNDKQQLTQISHSGTKCSKSFSYDAKGRLIDVVEKIGNASWQSTYTFDSYGRISTLKHPSGIIETLGYNTNGYLATISVGGTTLYTINQKNVRGQIIGATYGSSLTATNEFDDYGYPTATKTGTIQDYRYQFDALTGNLSMRKNYLKTLSESFGYDDLDRLTSVTGPQNLNNTYNANGNIKTKSDIGTTELTYGANAGPYALTGLTSSTNLIPTAAQVIYYTSFEKVLNITENNYVASFIYNTDQERAQMSITQNGTSTLKRWYIGGSYMKDSVAGSIKQYTYLGGDAYTAPLVAVTQNGTTAYYFLLRDYLGNTTHVVAAADNSLKAEYSYDAWGRRRNPATWSYDMTGQPDLFAGRGYTGHEHLPQFNLINMNGRMYDPVIGRFLSPDNYVQEPDYTQSLNRYAYCVNNPLKFTDSSGDFFFVPIIIGAAIGAASGAIMAHQKGAHGFGEWAGYVGGGALIGGLSGGAAAGISAAGGGAMLAGAGAGAVGGAGFSGLATDWNGGAMIKGAFIGAASGFIGGGFASAIGGGWGALAGGAASSTAGQLLSTGGVNWAQVGVSAALSFGMYHAMSYMQWKSIGGKVNGIDVNYRGLCRINAAYQRSKFWHKEYGGYIFDGGEVRLRGASHRFTHEFNRGNLNIAKATFHIHWARGSSLYAFNTETEDYSRIGSNALQIDAAMQAKYGSLGYTEIDETFWYHSPNDLANLPGNSFVISGGGYSFYNGSLSTYNSYSDPFMRYFLFSNY
jgi:RHS repeat-associated protein